MRRLRLPLGEIEYLDTGGPGRPLVFLHGLAMNPSVWRHVIAQLAGEYRCLAPVMPVGGHRLPIPADRTLSPASVAAMVGDFIEELRLPAPVVVEVDGGRAQTLAATRPGLLGGLVLVSCEAFDNYPPGLAGRAVSLAARTPGGLAGMVAALRIRPLRRLPIAFGQMSKRPVPDEIMDDWLEPLISSAAIRRDLKRYLLGAYPTEMIEAAEGLRAFERPALVVWAREDRMMPLAHGQRLAALLPKGRLEVLDDCLTLIPEDQPKALADFVRRFAREAVDKPAARRALR